MTSAYTATQLAYVRSPSSASWADGAARQGVYGKNSTNRVGAIKFGSLRDDVDWGTQAISRIVITLTYAKSGASRPKIVGLYEGAKSSISGSGSSMLGAPIGEFPSGGDAYRATLTVVFSESTNPDVFRGLTRWLRGGNTNVLSVYKKEAATGEYSTNYLSITKASLSIDHEPTGSGGKLDKSSVDAGQKITLTVDPMQAPGTVTHAVSWRINDVSTPETALTGLTSEFVVPLEWLNQITESISGRAYCELTTLIDGVPTATQAIPFDVFAPASVVPTFTASAVPVSTVGGYWQHLSRARLSIEGASAPYSARIVTYSIVGNGVTSSDATVDTPVFTTAGAKTYQLAVADSRGRSSTRTVSIDVSALAAPEIETFSIRRYSSYIDDQGQTQYKNDPSGVHVWVSLAASIDTAGGNNTPVAYIEYSPIGSQRAQPVRVPVVWPPGAASVQLVNDRTLIDAEIPLQNAYEFVLHVDDLHAGTTAASRVETSWTTVHIENSGYGVAVGKYSSASESEPKTESAWPIYGSQGYSIDVCLKREPLTVTSGFEASGSAPTVSRVGALVYLDGMALAVKKMALTEKEVTVATLPEWARPKFAVSVIQQSSSRRLFWLRVFPDGRVTVSRNRVVDTYVEANVGNMFNLSASWIAADAIK